MAHVDRAIRRVTSLIRPTKAGRLSFGAYFRRYPARVDADDWALARGFVEGFEAAPLDSFSARSIAGETFDDEHQFDVVGGYGRLVDALVLAARRAGASLRAHSPVRSIHWKKGAVTATTRGGRRFSGRAAIVALPLGVLQARSGPGAVRFRPDPGPARRALAGMGLGHVARMAFRFKAGFWRRLPKSLRGRGSHGFGFLHDPEGTVPVWWSHSREPVLVAWAGGPAAKALLELKPRARRAAALRSLADGLGLPVKAVDGAVADWTTHNWTNDPFSRGAYSFIAAGHDGSGAILRRPVKATLHFCGEATAEGAEVGTVHGALESGLRAAARVRETLGRTA